MLKQEFHVACPRLKLFVIGWLAVIEFKRFKRTVEFNAWLLALDESIALVLVALLDKYKEDGVLPNTAGMLKGCDGLGEIRFKFGSGYRVYFCRYGDVVLLLINGGDKDSQVHDIKVAQAIKNREIEKVRLQRG